MRVMLGRRTMLLLSPGFLTSGLEPEYVDLIEKALQSQVLVSTLNARGLLRRGPISPSACRAMKC
jgi:hypothetical protein